MNRHKNPLLAHAKVANIFEGNNFQTCLVQNEHKFAQLTFFATASGFYDRKSTLKRHSITPTFKFILEKTVVNSRY
jgi:hypothetical protein